LGKNQTTFNEKQLVFYLGKKQLGTLDEKRIGVLFWAQNNYPSMRNTRCFFFPGKNQNHLDEKHSLGVISG
jgi:hypothetical protein